MSEDLLSMTRNAYDVVAQSYARLLPDASYEAPLDAAMIEHFATQLAPGARVLDAGCGAGRMLAHLASLDPSLSLSGLDLSPAMVAEARTANPGIEIAVGELAALGYEDSSFDGVLAWYSIIHTPTDGLGAIFDEFHRVLKADGLLLALFAPFDGDPIGPC
ncbi:methyltransferase domain-containing protein [Sinomonas sp. JGH33]|uniref:Methyltransferase domain-containing protein n=1 Tax=Sinomonas terricola TaxID=3110330 RepID=A0ABU5T7U0_9MICC|nr:methyltransferase domain-containing protein [Sinomonas sp. JGH33]MEA5455763.1 methyltransferase domain-containing protein [Sinomonas sp. JGH33]